MAIRSSGLGIIHATSNPVVMKCHVSHGAAGALMMPYVMKFNLIGSIEKFAALAHAMGVPVEGLSPMDAALLAMNAVKHLIRDLNMPERLRDIGVEKSDLGEFAKVVMKRGTRLLQENPREAVENDLLSIYESAW